METIKLGTQGDPIDFRFRSAAEFSRAIPGEVEFVSEPYVVAGAITEISGKIKSAGKTTFLMAMAKAVLDGQFL